ncbi:XrtA-associated tyrosine autokinase [uncultured Paraglaciecola sp.]|uniref:XrtA-associated tyrosine autokinase n=1 Tax=uncultured Paraglaciecola sp. TaxID=1765024 RepID=UPI002635C6EB|nr:XrtA-associated tyrosine autokinase [uncultured Paraglaciecola sp.]
MNSIEKALQKNKALAEDKKKQQAEQTPVEPTIQTMDKQPAATESLHHESPSEAVDNVPPVVDEPKTEVSAEPATQQKKIDLTELQNGFVNKDRQVINEEFRAIKRKVLGNAFGPLSKSLNNSNIIMVSSPNPNEGKTFTAINLALSIALEQDKTVLLVDADVLRPSVMKIINQPFENGLMEYLLGDVDDLSEVIYHTSIDTLRIIPAGKSHHLSTELLASEKMLETVSEFANRYPDRIVIFDTPPLLGINETAILANLAGQAVIVVQEGKTNLNRIALSVEQLNPDMAKGFVINKAHKGAKSGAGYYGYYYGADN